MFENQSWMNELSATLQSTRTGSVVQRLAERLRSDVTNSKKQKSKTLPESVEPYPEEVDEMLNHSVGPLQYERDETWRQEVIDEYRFNLQDMISIARSAKAKIVFVSPVSNLRGTSPFKSLFDDGTDTEALSSQLQTATQQLRDNQLENALKTIREVVKNSPRSADAHYLLGQILFAREEWSEAEQAFERALNEDVCPLRAIKPLRDILRSVTTQADVPLVDTEQLLRQASLAKNGHACLGDDYFLDHVHPTLELHRSLGDRNSVV